MELEVDSCKAVSGYYKLFSELIDRWPPPSHFFSEPRWWCLACAVRV